MNLPAPFDCLASEPGPKMLREALAHYALHEVFGPKSNDEILNWAREVGAYFGPGDKRNYYDNDGISWCALFLAHCARAAGWALPRNPLAALSWAKWGNPAPDGIAMLGDVLVKDHHAGIYVGQTDSLYYSLGGNQSDMVCITGFAQNEFTHVRRAPWRIAQPDNVRIIELA